MRQSMMFSAALALAVQVGSAEPFIPVFSAGREQGGGKCQFPELAVFRDGIPSYSVNSAMKPNPRPFTKHAEYPKKYVRRIEGTNRRTTPYSFEEMFANPAGSIDSDYARSGKPFFIYERMSRPPFFLPTDGCPLARRDTYEAWKKTHPGFIAYNSLWEFDSDSNYFEGFYDKTGDESIAAELHAAFGPPDAKGRGHRVRWAEKIFKIAADFHFGERGIYPLCSGIPGYEHIFGAMGAKGLWYEATTQSAGPWSTAAAFVRGAARQRDLDFGWYMAHYMTGWTRAGKLVKGHNMHAYGYSGLLEKPCPHRGESRSLFRRKTLFGWLSGAKYLQCEAWSHLFIDRVDGKDVPSVNARDFNEIYELSKTTARGEPFTPLAVLTPLAEPCAVTYLNGKLLDPRSQTEIFNTLVPFLGPDGKPAVNRRAGDQGCFFNSEFANAFDVLSPDSGQDSAAFGKALGRYRHVLIAGDAFDKAKFDAKALAAFEKAGGKVHRYPSPGCDTPEKLRALLRAIQDETMPVRVEGDIQWGVNEVEVEGRGRERRWLVYLINNRGVIKFADEPEEFDPEKTAHVTVTVKSTGEKLVADVKPGDFKLLALRSF